MLKNKLAQANVPLINEHFDIKCIYRKQQYDKNDFYLLDKPIDNRGYNNHYYQVSHIPEWQKNWSAIVSHNT